MKRLLTVFALVLLSLVLVIYCRAQPSFVDAVYVNILWPTLARWMSGLTGRVGGSVIEGTAALAAVLAGAGILLYGFRAVRRRSVKPLLAPLRGVAGGLCLLLALYSFTWAPLYYRTPVAQAMALPVRPRTGNELSSLIDALTYQGIKLRLRLKEDAAGVVMLPYSRRSVLRRAKDAADSLGAVLSPGSGTQGRAKNTEDAPDLLAAAQLLPASGTQERAMDTANAPDLPTAAQLLPGSDTQDRAKNTAHAADSLAAAQLLPGSSMQERAKNTTAKKNALMPGQTALQRSKDASVSLTASQPAPLPPGFPAPKAMRYPRLFGALNVAGMYSPWTFEAVVNLQDMDIAIPFTACHEAAHQRGWAREEEANFIAFLACGQGDDTFKYSAILTALDYALTSLRSRDEAGWTTRMSMMPAPILRDLRAMNAAMPGDSPSAARQGAWQATVGDAFLRVNGQSGGLGSYGMMIDLLIAWREKHGSLWVTVGP